MTDRHAGNVSRHTTNGALSEDKQDGRLNLGRSFEQEFDRPEGLPICHAMDSSHVRIETGHSHNPFFPHVAPIQTSSLIEA